MVRAFLYPLRESLKTMQFWKMKGKKLHTKIKKMYVICIYVFIIYLGNMVFRNPALVSPESLSLRELSHRGPRDKKFEVPKLENIE